MLIHLLRQVGSQERDQLAAFLMTPRRDRTETDAHWIVERMRDHGSLEYARQVAHGLAGAALHEYSLAFAALPESRDKRFIEALTTWVLERA